MKSLESFILTLISECSATCCRSAFISCFDLACILFNDASDSVNFLLRSALTEDSRSNSDFKLSCTTGKEILMKNYKT